MNNICASEYGPSICLGMPKEARRTANMDAARKQPGTKSVNCMKMHWARKAPTRGSWMLSLTQPLGLNSQPQNQRYETPSLRQPQSWHFTRPYDGC